MQHHATLERCSAGRCPRPARPGRKLCAKCALYFRERNRRLYVEQKAQREEAGTCLACAGERVPGRKRCASCLANRRAYGERWRCMRRRSGWCSTCGRVEMPKERRTCPSCVERAARFRSAPAPWRWRRGQQLAPDQRKCSSRLCPRPALDGYRVCERCQVSFRRALDRQRTAWRTRRAAGERLCTITGCPRVPAEDRARCAHHLEISQRSSRKHSQARYAAWRARRMAGEPLCSDMGCYRPLAPGRASCQVHLDRARAYMQQQKRAG